MPALAVVEQLTEAQRQQLHSLYQNEWWTRDRTLEETHRVVDGSQICLGLVEDVRTIELYCLPELVPFHGRYGFTDDVGGLRLMRRSAV